FRSHTTVHPNMSVSAFFSSILQVDAPGASRFARISAELLHELLHGLSTEVEGATLCAPAFRCRNLCALWARHLKFSMFLAMQGSLRYSIAGADRWPCHTASQRSHRVLRAGDAQGVAALWRRGDPDVACQG